MADRLLIAEYSKAGRPVITDDVNAGYLVGDRLFDTTNKAFWRCTNNSAGAAVWTAASAITTNYVHPADSNQATPAVNTWYNLGGALISLSASEQGKHRIIAALSIEVVVAADANRAAAIDIMLSNSATPGAGSLIVGELVARTVTGAVLTYRECVTLVGIPALAASAIIYVHARYTNLVNTPTVNSFALRGLKTQIQMQHVSVE